MKWVLLASLLQCSCLMQTITTEVEIHDRSAVALLGPDGAVVLPESPAASAAPLASGRSATSESSSAAYTVTARREASGEIAVDWTTSVPLAGGDRYVLLPAHDSIVFREPLANVLPDATSPRFTLPLCATVASHGYRGVSSSAVVPRALLAHCEGTTVVHYSLDTSWSNVVLHERTRPDHGGAWLIVGLATLTFGVMAGFVFSLSPKDLTGGQGTQIALGVGTAAVGLTFDLAMLPTLFASDRDAYVRR